jgi:hypothetical protein
VFNDYICLISCFDDYYTGAFIAFNYFANYYTVTYYGLLELEEEAIVFMFLGAIGGVVVVFETLGLVAVDADPSRDVIGLLPNPRPVDGVPKVVNKLGVGLLDLSDFVKLNIFCIYY